MSTSRACEPLSESSVFTSSLSTAFAVLVTVLALSLGASGRARALPAEPGRAREAQAEDEAARAAVLQHLRLQNVAAKRREGLWLLGWGAVNLAAGSLAAGLFRDDEAALSGAVTSASFGAINALLSLGFLDLSGARERAIRDADLTSADELMAERDREVRAQLRSGQTFALNAGLDVAYLAAGALLMALGHRRAPDAPTWEQGTGAAMLVQGAFLFGFDIACWRRANGRALRVAR